MIADRFFAAQRIMGVLHLFGAALLFLATTITNNAAFYWVILFYSLLYMPTIALSNSIAFFQMSDPGKQFPWIRVFGTLGWIVAGLIIGGLKIEPTTYIFMIAAGVSVLLGSIEFCSSKHATKRQSRDVRIASIGDRRICIIQKQTISYIFHRCYFGLYPFVILLWMGQSIFK